MRWVSGFLFLLLPLWAQAPQPRKKIAVALEGGSALGIAHIGVLEWLEENHIPVDYIAGTSMGSLVGGLYATGRSPAELRAIVKDADWQRLLGGEVPFRDLSFRRKEDRTAYPNLIELGLKNGLSLPGGINTGHEIGLLLSRMTLAYPDLKSFDELPTPFRCVATNLVTGEEEVFSKGVLADALRSSMSLPGVFRPANRNGKLYVDGAVLANLPVDIARQMGADIVIAVHLAKPPVDPKTLRTFPAVIDRTVGIVVSANELKMIERADIVVSIDLASFNPSDYPKSKELADAGKGAAAKKAGILQTFVLPPAEWEQFQKQREARRRPDPVQVSTVKVEAESEGQRRLLEKTLTPLVANGFNPDVIEHELTRSAGAGVFSNLRYSVHGKELLVQTETKLHGPPFLVPLIELDGSDIQNFRFSAGARMTFLGLGAPRAEWRNDVVVGSRYRLASEYWLPLRTDSKWFVAPKAFAGTERFPLYLNSDHIADYRIRRSGVGGDFGYQFNRAMELRVGHTTSWIAASRDIGDPIFPRFDYRVDVPGARFRYLGYDDPIVPREGARVEASFDYVLTQGPQAEVQASLFRRVKTNGSLFVGFSGGSTFENRFLDFRSYSLGGPLRLPAYATNELFGNEYMLGTAGYLRELKPGLSILGTRIYGAAWLQLGRVSAFPSGDPRVAASAAGAVLVRTFLGPVFAGGAWGDRGHGRIFVGVGRFF